jgi:hypothetical protein
MKPNPIKYLIAGLLLISNSAFASLTSANLYQCSGKNISVSYSSTSLIGEPQLSITINKKSYSAIGSKAITSQKTVVGNLITLTKTSKPDLYSDTLTVLLPDINVSALGKQITFNSQLLITRTADSIAGPQLVNGVIQSNSAKTLICTAQAVVF